MRKLIHHTLMAAPTFALLLACGGTTPTMPGGDDGTTPPASTGDASDKGTDAPGPDTGSGGSNDSGGQGAETVPPNDGRDNGTNPKAPVCPYEGPAILNPSDFPDCGEGCGFAHCLPSVVVPSDLQGLLAPCPGGDSLCVPDEFIETAGNMIPETCQAVGGVEGRCMSPCIPEVEKNAALLEQGSCADGFLCTPCVNPLDGISTGACEVACDPGPSEPPVVFDACCRGAGTCVPSELAEPYTDLLGPGECAPNEGLLCAPNDYIESVEIRSCQTTIGGFLGSPDGACISECLPIVETVGIVLFQDGCGSGEKCVPCALNAFGFEIPTGACDFITP